MSDGLTRKPQRPMIYRVQGQHPGKSDSVQPGAREPGRPVSRTEDGDPRRSLEGKFAPAVPVCSVQAPQDGTESATLVTPSVKG